MLRTTTATLVVLSLAAATTACRSPTTPAAPGDTGASPTPMPTPTETTSTAAAPPADSVDAAPVGPGDVAAANAFALRAYRAVASSQPGANALVSPPSLRLALGMVLLGARGETAQEMSAALGLDAAPAAVVAEARAESAAWSSVGGPGVVLSVANRLWGDKTLALEPAFVTQSRAGFGAGLEQVDFVGAFEPARATINGWVKTETRDKIPELLPAGSLSTLTRLVVTNAVYFDGKWKTPFDPKATQPAPFFVGGKQQVQVPMMQQKSRIQYLRSAAARAAFVELPYGDGAMSMVIALPDERTGLGALEAALDGALLDAVAKDGARVEVVLSLPRFEFSAGGSVKPALQALGMRRAFDAQRAELDGIAARAELSVSDVFHKTFVRVDEAGTEAAAATGVVIATRSAAVTPPPRFTADRPFLFVLREAKTGRVLFVGRVEDPRKT